MIMATVRTGTEPTAAENLHFLDAPLTSLDQHAMAELQEDHALIMSFSFFRLPVGLRGMILGLYSRAPLRREIRCPDSTASKRSYAGKTLRGQDALPQSMWYPRGFWRPSVSLLLLNHQMHEEAASVLYGKYPFFLDVASVAPR